MNKVRQPLNVKGNNESKEKGEINMNKLEIQQNNSTEFFFEGNSRVRTVLVNEGMVCR